MRPMGRNFSGSDEPDRLGSLSRSAAVAALAVFVGLRPAPGTAAAPRILSMNLCTDQLLVPLADDFRGISLGSADTRATFGNPLLPVMRATRNYRERRGQTPAIRPDIVVASLYDKRLTRELLKENGLHLAEFAVPRTSTRSRRRFSRRWAISSVIPTAPAPRSRGWTTRSRARESSVPASLQGVAVCSALAPLGVRHRQSAQAPLAETGLSNAAGDSALPSAATSLRRS